MIDKVAFSIEDIRAVLFGLRETARKRLLADLLFVSENGGEGEELPPLQLVRIVDDMGCTDEGWSFLTDGRNKFAVDGEEWLAGRVFREARLRERFMRKARAGEEGKGRARWNERTVEGYFRQVRQFKEELFTLAHLSAGAPARGTELITVMHRSYYICGIFNRSKTHLLKSLNSRRRVMKRKKGRGARGKKKDA